MSNSPLVSVTILSPNNSGKRTHSIDRITPHCMAGHCSARNLGEWFSKESTKASSNYGVDDSGTVAMYVPEDSRSWCSSSNENDQRAVTIECESDGSEPYRMTEIVFATLTNLCVDICKRNGKKKLIWFGDKDKTLSYQPKPDEMILTVHCWFKNKACPGNWLLSRMQILADTVTYLLEEEHILYRVQVGAYSIKSNAEEMERRLKEMGIDCFIVEVKQ